MQLHLKFTIRSARLCYMGMIMFSTLSHMTNIFIHNLCTFMEIQFTSKCNPYSPLQSSRPYRKGYKLAHKSVTVFLLNTVATSANKVYKQTKTTRHQARNRVLAHLLAIYLGKREVHQTSNKLLLYFFTALLASD